MLKSEAINKYGKYWKKMIDSGWLTGITVSIVDGEMDIPERDLDVAFRAAKGEKINHLEWD